ncbi:hypothetical protein [Devosia sp. 1635]|uniref:hypothetical protein n=1 Tax=Devosia sp. 1635 TaxID=2726066 RepID=UPI0015648C18|nr:hypothetical protein [Devosia sp. 1635]
MAAESGQSTRISNKFCWEAGDLQLVSINEVANCSPSALDTLATGHVNELQLTSTKEKPDLQRSAVDELAEANHLPKQAGSGEPT